MTTAEASLLIQVYGPMQSKTEATTQILDVARRLLQREADQILTREKNLFRDLGRVEYVKSKV